MPAAILAFTVEVHDVPIGGEEPCAMPLLDGRPLDALALPGETLEGFAPDELADRLDGGADAAARTRLLRCACGDVDCGGLAARISLTPDEVVWHDFARVHAGAEHPLDHPPCHFGRTAYAAAVATLRAA